jgi:hypothetical protein
MGCGDLGYHSIGFYLSSIGQEYYGLGMATLSKWNYKALLIVEESVFSRFLPVLKLTTFVNC